MKKILITLAVLLLTTVVIFAAGEQEKEIKGPVVLKALTIGPGPVPITRAGNLETAAELLKAEGVDLELEVTFSTQKYGPYRTSFSLAYAAGSAPDIMSEDQDILPEYAEEGMILPLDSYIEASGFRGSGSLFRLGRTHSPRFCYVHVNL